MSGDPQCPECRHESHAGRCPYILLTPSLPPGNHSPGGQCRCKEEHHGTDSPASGDSRGGAVPVGDAQGRALTESAEDVLARIREVGQTMQDGAARLEGVR